MDAEDGHGDDLMDGEEEIAHSQPFGVGSDSSSDDGEDIESDFDENSGAPSVGAMSGSASGGGIADGAGGDGVGGAGGVDSTLFVFTNNKAGMEGVDRDHVNKVVYEMSKGSRFFENEQRKNAKTAERVEAMKQKIARARATHGRSLSEYSPVVEDLVKQLEASRDLSRVWCCLDMDMFYAAVEIREQPHLKDKPVAVGGMSMISTTNYIARKYGVRAAMPGFIGKKLCPELVFVHHHSDLYKKVSEQVRDIIHCYDPNSESMSLDEFIFDLTDYVKAHPGTTAEVVLEEIRNRIRSETQLTASAGIAANKMLAKICSDLNKPDGQYSLARDADKIREFMAALAVRKVPGVGKVSERVLREAMGITTCADILANRALLHLVGSTIQTKYLLRAALGLSSTEHSVRAEAGQDGGRKSLSHERTFRDLSDTSQLNAMCLKLCDLVAADLTRKGIEGSLLTLKLKTSDFVIKSRAAPLPEPSSRSQDLSDVALRLLRAELPLTLRLMGVRVSSLRTVLENGGDGKSSGRARQVALHKFIAVGGTCAGAGAGAGAGSGAGAGAGVIRPAVNTADTDALHGSLHASGATVVDSTQARAKPRRSLRQSLTCPVCGVTFENVLNSEFNSHVDHCLAPASQGEPNAHSMAGASTSISANASLFKGDKGVKRSAPDSANTANTAVKANADSGTGNGVAVDAGMESDGVVVVDDGEPTAAAGTIDTRVHGHVARASSTQTNEIACLACTFVNKADARMCAICNTAFVRTRQGTGQGLKSGKSKSRRLSPNGSNGGAGGAGGVTLKALWRR